MEHIKNPTYGKDIKSIVTTLYDIYGDGEDQKVWDFLNKPHALLIGKTPNEVAQIEPEGGKIVKDLIWKAQHSFPV